MNFITFKMPMFKTIHLVIIFAMALLIVSDFNGAQATSSSSSSRSSCVRDDHLLEYNSQTHICCGGQVEVQPTVGIRACCGNTMTGTFYFHGEKMCCGGTLRDVSPDLKCCNRQHFYNDTTQTCCGAEVIDLSEGKVCCPGPNSGLLQGFPGLGGNHKCCGTSGPYWPKTELCCEVGKESSIIRERLSGGQVECCGLNRMDAATHMCCAQEQIPRQPHLECCGSGTYNVTTQICCRDRAVARGPNGGYECCGEQSFNPDNEVCCFGEVNSIGHGKCCVGPRQNFSEYQPGKQSCCNSVVSAIPEITGIQECCSGEAYLTSSQMCCNGKLFYRGEDLECCGSGTYNRRTHLCCNDRMIPRLNPNHQCCASTSFNPSTQTCCGGQVHPQVGKCCRLSMDTFEVFNEQTQTCCGIMDWNAMLYTGEIHVGSASSMTCCGAQLLEFNQLCYNNIPIERSNPGHNEICRYYSNNELMYSTFNKEEAYCDISSGVTAIPPGRELCGRSTYNPETHLCCDEHLHVIDHRADADTTCCGFNAYDKTWQSCLLGNVFNIPQEYAGNCRDEAFDTRTDTCDVNSEIRPIEEVEQYPERCGTEPFRPAEHECCYGELIGPGFTCCGVRSWETPGTTLGEGQCCFDARDGSSKGYNNQTQICCLGEIYDMEGPDIECCGSDPYNPADASSICCGHRQYAVTNGKTECTGTTPHRQDQIVCDGVVYQASSGGTCCGKSLINPESHVCCDGIPNSKESEDTRCCGKVSYNSLTQTCCGDSLYESHSNQACCGSVDFNTNDQVCHESRGQFYVFRKEDEGMLCREGSYDASIHTCCQGFLHKHIAGGECCGNKVVRNPNEEVCCGGELKQKKRGHTECCGNRFMFNPDVHQCCGGKRMPRYSAYRQCCNDHIISAWEECVE